MQRTTILQVGDPLDSHFSFSVHGQTCLAIYFVSFHGVGCILSIAWISWNHGFGFHLLDNISEDLLDIEICISSDDFDGQGEIPVQIFYHG